MNRWSGKVAFVTGASSGIGAATVRALVHEGLKVVGVARRVANIEKIATELKDEPGKLYALRCDLTREDEILEIFEWIKENLGGVDVMINNAGIIYPAGITDGDTEGFRRVLDINVMAVAICTREAVQSMISRNFDGYIINVNSVMGHYLNNESRYLNLYPSSKFALTAMTEVLRKELITVKTKIRVSSISPGLVNTEILTAVAGSRASDELFATVPCLQPEDVSNAIIYVLGTPAYVQVCEMIIRPVGELKA